MTVVWIRFRHFRNPTKSMVREFVGQALRSGQIKPLEGASVDGAPHSHIHPEIVTVAEIALESLPLSFRGFAFCSKRDKHRWSRAEGRERALERARMVRDKYGPSLIDRGEEPFPPGGTGATPAGGEKE